MLSTTLRPWLCGVPQAGWGGTTLDGYVEIVGLRPEIAGDEAECRQVLDALVGSGYAQTVKVKKDEEPRWELTELGHDALVAPIEPDEGAEAHEVLLELQPGIAASKSEVRA